MMNKIKNIFNNIVLGRILVVFIVGLVSRIVIDIIFEINVFVEYNPISLIYYGVMLLFSSVICDLQFINSFNFKLVKEAINMFLENKYSSDNKLVCGDNINKVSTSSVRENQLNYAHNSGDRNKDISRVSSRTSSSRSGSAGVNGLYGENRRVRRPSAGVVGLYGDPNNRELNRVYKENTDVRDQNIARNRPIRKIEISRVEDGRFNSGDRVSGFNTASNTASPRSVNYNNNHLSNVYEGSVNESVRGVDTFVVVDNEGRVIGTRPNPDYVPRELPISLREYSENSYYAGSRESSRYRAPNAPRIPNYATPETMSPLFPSSSRGGSSNGGSSNGGSRYYSSTSSVVDKCWYSIKANTSVRGSYSSSNSDTRRMDHLHEKCKHIADKISNNFNPYNQDNYKDRKGYKKNKGSLWGRK